MSNSILKLLEKIPKSHGIYEFFNDSGDIIYIGKSVNLKARVNSYFNSKKNLNFGKQKMVKQIVDIKTIITNNETESLILETTLIKKHLPKYNILMKDGKNHIYIKITDEIIPKIIKTRIKKGTGNYFGPYTSTGYINNVLKFIKKNFGYRSCNIDFEKKDEIYIGIIKSGGIKIPCMDYYIGTCSGPCLLKSENIEKYKNNIEQVKLFLKGNIGEVVKKLENNMLEKAKKLEFEEAEKIKKLLESINGLNVYQIVREGVKGDFKVVNFVEKFDKFYIGLIEIKDSKITGFYNYDIKNELKENKEEIIKEFIERKFVEELEINLENTSQENTSPPTPLLGKEKGVGKNINFIIPFDIKEGLNENINIEVPKIGVKKDLLSLCYKNIYEYAYKSHLDSLSTKGFTKKNMQNLLEILGYKEINKSLVFECNDISHISGSHTVASRSVIENGKSNTSKYKKFKINTLENGEINDFGALEEIMERRLKEIKKSKEDLKTGFIPDLIVIDGGKGQLSSVVKICKKYNVDLQIIGIAKREEEIFLPGKKEPIILDKESNELKLIQKIRDEAHRFAITFNRDKRIKSMKINILESLPGFGPKTRKKLLQKYGNVDNLLGIEEQELLKIVSKSQYETLQNHGIV